MHTSLNQEQLWGWFSYKSLHRTSWLAFNLEWCLWIRLVREIRDPGIQKITRGRRNDHCFVENQRYEVGVQLSSIKIGYSGPHRYTLMTWSGKLSFLAELMTDSILMLWRTGSCFKSHLSNPQVPLRMTNIYELHPCTGGIHVACLSTNVWEYHPYHR